MDTRQLKKVLEAQRDLYLKPDDKILVIVTESFKNAPITTVLQNYDKNIHFIPDTLLPSQKYDLNKSLFSGQTLGWIISNVSLSHSIGSQMINHGMFVISNPGITKDWLAMLDPNNASFCQEKADKLESLIGGDVGGEIHIIADDGTNLKLKVPNGNWDKEVGKRQGVGTNGLFGEFVTSPYEANGRYVLQPGDFLTSPINELVEKVTLEIRHNRIIDIQNGTQAKTLKMMLMDSDDQKAFNLGEFAIGINPGRPKKVLRSVVAEKLIGGIHIAIGTNSICLKKTCPDIKKFHYGRYNAGVHIDCIKFGASVFFKKENDQTVILLRNGNLTV